MAVIKKYDVAGDTAAHDLIGESGYFNTTNDDTRYTTTVTSSSSKFTEKTFYDGNYISYTEFDYTAVTSPSPDHKVTAARKYDTSGNLLEQWTSLNIMVSEIVETGSFGLFEGEDSVEGLSLIHI